MSLRALAREVGVSDAHLSRVIRAVGYRKAPSGDLAGRVARAFGLPVGYFREYREKVVLDAVKRDSQLREELYERITQGRHRARSRL